jgi:hypothetical protein
MKMQRINALVLAAVCSVCVEGAVLVSNLAEPTIPGENDTAIHLNQWAWQSFRTDNQAYKLVDIRTVLGDSTVGAGVVAELRVYDTGALLTTMAVPSLAGALSLKTLTPDNPVTLNPMTIYALVIGASGPGSFFWRYAEGNNTTGPGSLIDFAYSTDQGVTFPDVRSEDFYLMQVNADAAGVPEPCTLGLCGSALIAVSILRGRQLPIRATNATAATSPDGA